MNFIYFAENFVEDGGLNSDPSAIMIPVNRFLNTAPVNSESTKIVFGDVNGEEIGSDRITITLNHKSTPNGGGFKEVTKTLAAAMHKSPPTNDGFIVFADEEEDNDTISGAVNKKAEYDRGLIPLLKKDPPSEAAGAGRVQIERQWKFVTDSGLGLIQTGWTPGLIKINRWKTSGVIKTQVKVKLYGAKAAGSDANDVIGLDSLGLYSPIARYKPATMGILFRTEMSCLEAPAGNGEENINLVWNASGTLGCSQAGGTSYGINAGGDWVTGMTKVYEGGAPTDDHFAYLTEATTDSDGTTYTAGQFLITFYGYERSVGNNPWNGVTT